jgi:hypothetical protein
MLDNIHIGKIGREVGDRIIRNNHYSKTTTPGTKWTLGVFDNGVIKGVIQLGKGVQPKATMEFVEDTQMNQFLELNRLWLCDSLGKNSESKVLGLMFKWIKENDKDVKWLITFADGVMGKVGTIYQATNWIYTGYNKTGGLWITKDGVRLHNLHLYFKLENTKRETIEREYGTPLYRVIGGQFRYYYFLDKEWKSKLKREVLPYPKIDNIKDYIVVKKSNFTNENHWDEIQPLLK